MTLDRKNIDELFQNRMHDFEINPPTALWSRIDEEMGTLNKKKNRKIFWNVAVAASIAASFALGFFISEKMGHSINSEEITPVTAQIENENTTLIQESEISHNQVVDPILVLNEGNRVVSKRDPQHAQLVVNKVNSVSTRKNDIGTLQDEDIISNSEKVEEPVAILNGTIKETEEGTLAENELLMEEQESIEIETLNSWDGNELANISTEEVHYQDLFIADYKQDQTKNKIDKWEVGGQMAPLYSYRNIETENLALENSFNEYQSGVMAYAGGVEVSYKTDKRFSIQSGIYYSKIGHSNKGNTMITKSGSDASTIVSDEYSDVTYTAPGSQQNELYVNSSTGDIQPSNANVAIGSNQERNYASFVNSDVSFYGEGENVDILQYFEYVEVPLIAKYKIIDRKIDFNLLGGVSSHVLVGRPIYLMIDGQKEWFGETSGISKFNYSSVVGLGIAYPVTNSLTLSVEPTFKYYLNSFYNDVRNEASFHPYSVGMFTGLTYSF
ncbi:MAG: hypothetical protein JXB49_34030 [Bacteroidales bacterium]|nr:hypothetical protein [Bacteroidales bacterium]